MMSMDFIPKDSITVYPGLDALLWADTPNWVSDSLTLPSTEELNAMTAVALLARQAARSIHGFKGEHAPNSRDFPSLQRGQDNSETYASREAWLRENLPARALKRLLAEVTKRTQLLETELGNSNQLSAWPGGS